MKKTRVSRWAGLALFALVLSGCSGGSNETAGHNQQDVSFATDMIVHHQGAIDMARLAAANGASPAVRDLAARIEAAQGPEIQQMNEMLTTWGEEAVDPAASGKHGGHGEEKMPGMMTEDEMSALRGASGATFDRLFLTSMIKHHEGAITMSREEIQKGKDPQATALATKIAAEQEREIVEMRRLLG